MGAAACHRHTVTDTVGMAVGVAVAAMVGVAVGMAIIDIVGMAATDRIGV